MSAINASVTNCNEYEMIGQSPIMGLLLYPSFIFTYILLTLWAVTYPCVLPAHTLVFHNFLLDHQFFPHTQTASKYIYSFTTKGIILDIAE